MFVLIMVSSCSTTNSKNAQIQRLNWQVEDQQRQIDQLKHAISSSAESNSERPVSDEREEPISSQSQIDFVGWKDKENWQRIQDNMSAQQVIAILGQPTGEKKGLSYLTLFWEGNVSGSGYASGNVVFFDNQVSSIHPPVFLNQ
jgi:outer membrane protein assembly factor BamE (lipoprotein component of BamABCDE complex)